MRKLLLLLNLIFLSICNMNAQAYYTSNIDGYWAEWGYTLYKINGTEYNFVIHNPHDHPSDYIMKVNIKSIDYSKKINGMYRGYGVIEYITNNFVPDVKSYVRKFPHVTNPNDPDPKIRHKVNAEILVAKKRGKISCYNIFFEGYAVGWELPY